MAAWPHTGSSGAIHAPVVALLNKKGLKSSVLLCIFGNFSHIVCLWSFKKDLPMHCCLATIFYVEWFTHVCVVFYSIHGEPDRDRCLHQKVICLFLLVCFHFPLGHSSPNAVFMCLTFIMKQLFSFGSSRGVQDGQQATRSCTHL